MPLCCLSYLMYIMFQIRNMPYLCGEFWLDWAIKCTTSPVLTSSFGDRENVPNVVIALISNAPSVSQPSGMNFS